MDFDIVPAAEEDWPWIVEGSLAMVRANAYPDERGDFRVSHVLMEQVPTG